MGYRHHGIVRYIDYYGRIKRLTFGQKVKDQMLGRWKAMKKFQLFDGIYDHDIAGGYADKLQALWFEGREKIRKKANVGHDRKNG